MACFYCGNRNIHSPDVGACEESCAKAVCIQTTSSRPQDYHADQCNCGCAKLICIYEQSAHSRKKHNSAVEDCFPDSAGLSALGAAWAIEHSAQIQIDKSSADQAEIRRAVFRYVTILRPAERDLQLTFGSPENPNYPEFELPGRDQWTKVAATLVPHVLQSLVLSWPKIRNVDYKLELGRELNERLDKLAASDALPARLERNTESVLQSWFEFSPRLALLVAHHGAIGNFRFRTRALSFDLDKPWTSAPATLEAVGRQQGAPAV